MTLGLVGEPLLPQDLKAVTGYLNYVIGIASTTQDVGFVLGRNKCNALLLWMPHRVV